MSILNHLWGWAVERLGDSFQIGNDWLQETRAAVLTRPLTCIAVPRACGSLDDWIDWISMEVEKWTGDYPPRASGTAESVLETICLETAVEPAHGTEEPRGRLRMVMAEARKKCHHISTRVMVVCDPPDTVCAFLEEFAEIQQEISLLLFRFLVIRRTPVPGHHFQSVRFGPPVLLSNLNGVAPPVENDPGFWTEWYLVMTALWEAGGIPHVARELLEELRLERGYDINSAGFDRYIEARLRDYGRQKLGMVAPPPGIIQAGPVATIDEALWQEGHVVWRTGQFDLSPLHARAWIETISDERLGEVVRRRVLTNVPLSRWLSGWATTMEEALRLASLRVGKNEVDNYFKQQAPLARESKHSNRWEELGQNNLISLIDSANFMDLSGLVARFMAQKTKGAEAALLSRLNKFREARNHVVHQRRVTASDTLTLLRGIDWLRSQRLA